MGRGVAAFVLASLVALGCQGAPRVVRAPELPPVVADLQVITPEEGSSVSELRRRGDRALLEERWKDAADAFRTLVAAARVSNDPGLPTYLLDLGIADEGLANRESARRSYLEVARRAPASTDARTALLRVIALDDYLEDWTALGDAAATLLARSDLDEIDRLTGVGARALARVEASDDGPAMRDIQEGLDVVDRLGLGATGRLPLAAAQLRFALGEVRRVRSERIELIPVTSDFVAKVGSRCQGLLDAQSAYADAMRATEPHWTAVGAFRIGEMYAKLHRELMAIPPTPQAKTHAQRDLFFAMMHVRYRGLLEKGLEMMKRTAALANQSLELGPWVERAKAAQVEMAQALADEKAAIAKLPYDEATVQAALDDLERKTLAKKAKRPALLQ